MVGLNTIAARKPGLILPPSNIVLPNTALRYQLTKLISDIAVANYRADLGVTGTLNASALANQIGIAGPLLQATGANQPIVLPYSGEKYAYLSGVSGNSLSTPNAAANKITGDIDIRVKVALNSWLSGAAQTLLAKYTATGNQRQYQFGVTTTGLLTLVVSADGIAATTVSSSDATGLSAGATKWCRVTRRASDGLTQFFLSDDGGLGTQLGTDRTSLVGATVDGTAVLEIGTINAGTTSPSIGRVYSAKLYNAIGAATPVVDWNASDWPETTTNGATQASSTTGEVWTLNNTGTKLAQIVGSSQLLFDGAAHFMKAAPFTLNQPEAVILVASQVTWTSGDYLFDGNATNGGASAQVGVSPAIVLGAGGVNISNSDLAVNRYGIAVFGINAASSFVQINNNAKTTGNPGANNMGGFTLGANAAGATQGNLQVKEAILLNAVPSAAKLAQIISLLNSIHTVF